MPIYALRHELKMCVIVKTYNCSAVKTPENIREARIPRTKILPASCTLAGNTAKHLIDNTSVSHDQHPLP